MAGILDGSLGARSVNARRALRRNNDSANHLARRSAVYYDARNNVQGYYEEMPHRRHTKREHAAVMAVRYKYRDAKARERAAERAQRVWDKHTGTAAQRRERNRAIAASRAHDMRMAKTKPHTPTGAGALVAYVRSGIEDGAIEWHLIALDTVAAALADMKGK